MPSKDKGLFIRVRNGISLARLQCSLAMRGKKTLPWFILAVVLLFCTAASSYTQTRRLLASAAWVVRTHDTLFSLEKLLAESEQTESCARRYAARHNQFDMTCFEQSCRRVTQQLVLLRELMNDDPAQRRILDQVGYTLGKRLDFLQQSNLGQTRVANANDKASPLEQGAQLQEQIRAQVEVLEKAQQGLLAERLQARDRATTKATSALGAGFLFSATVLCVVFVKLKREIEKRVEAQFYLRLAYAAIDESHRQLTGIIESTPDCIAAVDPQLRWIAFNASYGRQFQAAYGNTPKAGRFIHECFGEHSDECVKLSALWHRTLAGETFTVTGEVNNSSQVQRTYETRYFPIRDRHGNPMAACQIARDISERKHFEDVLLRQSEELKRSNAELEQFAYVASHDLQEPLRMVASYMQLFAERYQGQLDAKADKYIGYAVDGARRMQALINDLLSLSRINSRGAKFTAADCEEVMGRVLHDLHASIRSSNALVECKGLPSVMADEQQLAQLFQNLVGNALKFRGAETPHIRLTATQEHGFWLFSVQDNGIGIAPEHADKIFILFQRLHSRHQYDGTGIGLAICKKIVERHGGRIWVESEPGRGSTFKFTLPVVQPVAKNPEWAKTEAAFA
ncbi:MAG: sensor histidine kinase [Candidatus Sulfotelmatobacter sp.]